MIEVYDSKSSVRGTMMAIHKPSTRPFSNRERTRQTMIDEAIDTVKAHIVRTPDVLGGKPRIAGHRIAVQHVVIWHERMGMSVDEIANEYGLSPADIHAALT
jgi:uncharacterized protein (DUF433 family)